MLNLKQPHTATRWWRRLLSASESSRTAQPAVARNERNACPVQADADAAATRGPVDTRIDHRDGPSIASPLQQYITQRWSDLLEHKRLEVDVLIRAEMPRVSCEIFIGDEFIAADQLHVDVVVKPQPNAFIPEQLPTVLVFEKHTSRLVQQELNGLQLETPVFSRLAS